MTAWDAAVLALAAGLAVPLAGAARGRTGDRLAAVQLGTSVLTLILVLMSFAFDQSSFVDLALAVPLLSVPGTLAYALVLERWV